MKTCRAGLHQYEDELKRCPECRRINSLANYHKPRPITGKMKSCKSGLHQYPDHLPRCPECQRTSNTACNQSPQGKESRKRQRKSLWANPEKRAKQQAASKEWRESNEGKAYMEAYRKSPQAIAYEQSPERKAAIRERSQRPEVREKSKAWMKSPEGKKWLQAWRQSPEGKASAAAVKGKRTKIAAQGDLEPKQILERLEEFEGKCAYCSTILLTEGDYLHSHYQTIDHIVALLGGGQHTKANIVPACRGCNISKNNRDVWEWMKERGITPSEKLLPVLLEATEMHRTNPTP